MHDAPTDAPLGGVYPALTTPFTADGSIDHERLAADARRLAAAGVDGLVPVGTTGESATLTHDEHVAVVKTVVDAVDCPVVAGAGSNATHEAVSLSRRCVAAGADALLWISPYYNRPEPEGLREHYLELADAVDVPGIVYDVPARTGRAVDLDVAVELASHGNVAGFKAAGGDLARIGELAGRTREESFAVLSGEDALTLPVCSVGGVGAISVAANVEPARYVEMVHAALAGEYDRARRRHHELRDLFEALFVETNPVPVKAALAIRGHGPAHYRSPLSPLSAGNREYLRGVLADLEGGDAGDDPGRDDAPADPAGEDDAGDPAGEDDAGDPAGEDDAGDPARGETAVGEVSR